MRSGTLQLHQPPNSLRSTSNFLCYLPAAGAIDEAMFISAFEDVPKVNLYSHKDLEDNMVKIREIVNQQSNPWDKRIEAVSRHALSDGGKSDQCSGVVSVMVGYFLFALVVTKICFFFLLIHSQWRVSL